MKINMLYRVRMLISCLSILPKLRSPGVGLLIYTLLFCFSGAAFAEDSLKMQDSSYWQAPVSLSLTHDCDETHTEHCAVETPSGFECISTEPGDKFVCCKGSLELFSGMMLIPDRMSGLIVSSSA